MAAPACPALIFLGSKVGTDLIGTVEFGKAQAGRVLTLPDIHLTFIDDTAIDASLSEPSWLTSVVLSTIQKVDSVDGILKSYLQGVFTIPVADVNLNSTYHGTYTYKDGFQTSSAQDFCIIPAFFLALAFIGDQSNGIWSFDLASVRATITKIITTEGSGANPGRITWDNVNAKLAWADARGGDASLFIYTADDDGTSVAKVGATISANTSFDQNCNVMLTSNGRFAYNTINKRGIMDTDGNNQSHYNESNITNKDIAAASATDTGYFTDSGSDIVKVDFEAGSPAVIFTGTAVELVTDRVNLSELLVFYRFGKTIRRVSDAGTGDTEIYDGTDLDNIQILIGIHDGKIYFVYDSAGNTHIGSVLKAGTSFTDHGRIDDISQTNWSSSCGVISHSPLV